MTKIVRYLTVSIFEGWRPLGGHFLTSRPIFKLERFNLE